MPFHTATELLLKLAPFTVKTNPAPPAVAALGEIELIDGVDGQEQEMIDSQKSARAPERDTLFIVIIVTMVPALTAIQRSANLTLWRDCYHGRRTANVAD